MTDTLRDPNEIPFFRGTRTAVSEANAYTDAQIATLGGVYEPLGASAAAVAAHVALPDPHPQYLTQTEGNALYAPAGTVGILGNNDACRFIGSADQNLTAAAFTIIDLDAASFNNAPTVFTNDGAGRVTVSAAGVYTVSAAIAVEAQLAVVSNVVLGVFLNGTIVSASSAESTVAVGSAASMTTTTTLNCAAGDIVDCRVFYTTTIGGLLRRLIRTIGGATSTEVNHLSIVRQQKGSPAAEAIAAHVAEVDPHPQYLTPAEADAAYPQFASGTFTPVVIGTTTPGTVTYAVQHGLYFKIGRLVFIQIGLNFSAGTGTGNLRITGLPFPAVVQASGFAPLVSAYSNINFSGTVVYSGADSGQSYLNVGQFSKNMAFSNVPYDGAGQIYISGCYLTT